MALISVERGLQALPNFDPANAPAYTPVLEAASVIVQKYLNRNVIAADYDELIDGGGTYLPNLLLSEYPVQYISRISINPQNVFQVKMTDQDAARASVRLDSTSLYLSKSKNGVTTSHTITRSSCPTLGDLASAVDAFSAEGWDATATGIYAGYATTDLHSPQGAFDARHGGACYLRMHTLDLDDYKLRQETGEVVWNGGFSPGYQNIRILYRAGWDDVPAPITNAVAELAASVYLFRNINANLQQENVAGMWQYTASADKQFSNLSIASKYGLSLYKSHRINKFRVW